jgi:hypothetical protein
MFGLDCVIRDLFRRCRLGVSRVFFLKRCALLEVESAYGMRFGTKVTRYSHQVLRLCAEFLAGG